MLCDGDIDWAYVVGDWIYYDNKIGGESNAYKMHTDGSGETELPAKFCSIADGWLYYVDGLNNMNKISTDLSKRETIGTDRIESSQIESGPVESGGWLYYQYEGDDMLYKIKTDGTGFQKLTDAAVSYYNVEGGWVYYTARDSYCLYKISTDGGTPTKLTETVTLSINIVGDWIFYECNDKSGISLYKVHPDGTKRQFVEQL